MWRLVILVTAAFALTARAAPARSVAEIVVADGLAMHAERARHPDRPGPVFAGAETRRSQILQDIRAALAAGDAATVARFTDEIRYAAWQVTGFWLAHGESTAEIAAIKPTDAPARVGEAIDLMLKERRP